MTEQTAATNIATTLNNLEGNFGMDFAGAAMTGQGPDPALGIAIIVMGGPGAKLAMLISSKMRTFFSKLGKIFAGIPKVSKLKGLDLEDYVSKVMGSKGPIEIRISDRVGRFDGLAEKDGILYEVKSGWSTDLKSLEKLKKQVADQQVVAQAAGRDYIVITNSPIPAEIRAWFDAKGIRYIEMVD